jgi:cytochrome c-type biogenesis protein
LSTLAILATLAPAVQSSSIDFLATFTEGLLSFGSPCVLPLVPGYLSFISGVSVVGLIPPSYSPSTPTVTTTNAVKSIRNSGADTQRVIVATLAFIAGFTTVFITLFSLTYLLTDFLGTDLKTWIQLIAGIAVILMGLHFIGVFKLGFFNLEKRFHFSAANKPVGLVGAFLVGAAFAAGWSPCIGPFLGAAITKSLDSADAGSGIGLMLVYAAGLGIPFLLAGIFMNRLLSFLAIIRRHYHLIEIISGILLIIIGILIITNNLSELTRTLGRLQS